MLSATRMLTRDSPVRMHHHDAVLHVPEARKVLLRERTNRTAASTGGGKPAAPVHISCSSSNHHHHATALPYSSRTKKRCACANIETHLEACRNRAVRKPANEQLRCRSRGRSFIGRVRLLWRVRANAHLALALRIRDDDLVRQRRRREFFFFLQQAG